MKRLVPLAMLVILGGCAHGKMGRVDQELAPGAISKTTPIYVEAVDATKATFTGDKADDVQRATQEQSEIRNQYHRKIAAALRAKGYDARHVDEPAKEGLVISGNVTTIEHGSGAVRFFVGMGAGSANMYTNFRIEERAKAKAAKILSRFQVIATSGGNGYAGSFLDSHLIDGSEKVAQYVAGETKK